VELPKSPIQRVQYYDRQFLTVPDFQDEQSYHRDMRRLLNGSLFQSPHGHGVLFGLEVELDDPQAPQNLIVRPGVAVDENGRLLVVWSNGDGKNLAMLPLPPGQSWPKYVRISFGEKEKSRSEPPGSTAAGRPHDRWSEEPKLAFSDAPDGIVLAQVNLDNNRIQVELSGRKTAVLRSGGLHLEGSSAPAKDVTALVTTENGGAQALHVVYGYDEHRPPTTYPAALDVISQAKTAYGLYVQGAALEGLESVRVDGDALILGSATLGSMNAGIVNSICYNAGPEALSRGDLVMLAGDDIRQVGQSSAITNQAVLRAFPVVKALIQSDEDAARVVGFVVSRIPDTIQTGKVGGNGDRSITKGEFLFVVTRGLFESAKVTARGTELKLGGLLVGPRAKEDAGRAIPFDGALPSKPGTFVGKALKGLPKEGTDDEFKIFVNLM
jgi:hypothetical protein